MQWQRLARIMIGTVLAVAASMSFAARDPADGDGTEEHPEIARFPGFFIDNSQRNDFNEFRFATKSDDDESGDVKAGRYWFVDYILKEGTRQPSTVELMRNYENAFKQVGGRLVKRHPARAVYRVPMASGGERWVQLSIDNDGYRYQLAIIDVAAMEQKVEFSASDMAKAIQANGFVALTGIVFDTGRATIKPESEALLAEIVTLLGQDKSLKLSIEGHTDNAGDKKANLDLSQRRAAAVVSWLVGKGVDAKRLKSSGKGDSLPVGDNRSEDGRAKNRRVELVKI